MTPLEGWLTKAKETLSPHEVRAALLDTNPVFECLMDNHHWLDTNLVFQCLLPSPPPPPPPPRLMGKLSKPPKQSPSILVFHDTPPSPESHIFQ